MFNRFKNQDLGLLLIRLGLAYVFIVHGWPKLTHAANMVPFFSKLDIPFPLFMVYFVGAVEVLGGLAMLLGIFAEIFGLMLAVDMLVVILKVRFGAQANNWLGGHEFELMLLIMSLAIALIGAGRWAVMKHKVKEILV